MSEIGNCASLINPGLLLAMKRRGYTPFEAELGKMLRAIRKEKLILSEARLGKILGIDQATVHNAEKGKQFWRVDTWLKVGPVMGVPFYELFRRAAKKAEGAADVAIEIGGRKLTAEEWGFVQQIMDDPVFRALASGGRAGPPRFIDTDRPGTQFRPLGGRDGTDHPVTAGRKPKGAAHKGAAGSAAQGKKR